MADIEVSPGLAAFMADIARTHRAVEYDPHDPQREHIEAAARQAGLVLVPSETIQPRTIRGTAAPAPTPADGHTPLAAITAALAALGYCGVDADPFAAPLLGHLASAGWHLTYIGTTAPAGR